MDMSKKPKISVVMPVWNLYMNGRVESFDRAIESVFIQTYENIEIIIVNNNSTDGTELLIQKYVDSIATARTVFESTQGLWYAMQKGLREATGDYIGFMNSDDYYVRKDYMELATNEMQSVGAEWCFADAKRIYGDGVGYWKAEPYAIPFDICPCHQTVFMSVGAMREYGGFDLNYPVGCDNMLMRAFLKDQRKFVYVERIAVAYSDGGFSSQLENYLKNENAYAKSFYELAGKDFALEINKCRLLFHLQLFKERSKRFVLELADRISIALWKDYFLDQYNKYQAKTVKFKTVKYHLFGKILLLKIVRKSNKVKIFLFGILPIYVKRRNGNDNA
jgi:glycosyltransferase